MAVRFNALKLSKALAFAALLTPSGLVSQNAEPGWGIDCDNDVCTGFAVNSGSPLQIIVYTVEQSPVIEIVTPLGISLQKGVLIWVDENDVFETELLSCEVDGCRAFAPLEPRLMNALRNGLDLEVVVQTSRSRELLGFNFSLIGFTNMIEELIS